MTIRFIPDDDRLAELERIIQSMKAADAPRERIAIYASLAADVRARRPGAAAEVLADLSKRAESVIRSKSDLGYSTGTMMRLAECLMTRWPVVKLALEQYVSVDEVITDVLKEDGQ